MRATNIKLKLLFGVLVLSLALSLCVPVTLAKEPITIAKPSIHELIATYSALYGVSNEKLTKVLTCESNLNPRAVGDNGTSYGIAQIHLSSHKDISKEEALNPDFAIRWTAQQFALNKQNMWTCWKVAQDG